jgi:2-polyprenyl-6-methoxyphenol hydroxylase-like FAD-dependent oxidoreductase
MPDASGTIETPILIVGGGSVGLALASDLGGRGVTCLVIEQNERPADHPRATAINARSMEFMRRWGVADAVRQAAAPEDFPHTALYCSSLTGFEIARIERPHHGGRKPTMMSPERAQRCNQIWLDPILCERATSFTSTQLRFRWRFEGLREDGDRVVAIIHDLARDERRRIAARYLIDCSGGHSPIRRTLGINMSGSPYIGYHLSIYVRAPELWTHHDKGKAALVNFVEPEGLWRNLVTLDGRELYRFGLRGKEFYDHRGRRQADPARDHFGAPMDRAQRGGRQIQRRRGLSRRRRRPSQSSGLGAGAQYRPRRCGRSRLEARRRARGLGRPRAPAVV